MTANSSGCPGVVLQPRDVSEIHTLELHVDHLMRTEPVTPALPKPEPFRASFCPPVVATISISALNSLIDIGVEEKKRDSMHKDAFCELTHTVAVVILRERSLHIKELEDNHIDAWHEVANMRILTDASAIGSKFVSVILQSDELDAIEWGMTECIGIGAAEKAKFFFVDCIEIMISQAAATLKMNVVAENFVFKEL